MQMQIFLFQHTHVENTAFGAMYTTRQQEQELLKQAFLKDADTARKKKAKARRSSRAAAAEERRTRPERIAAQEAAIAAGTFGPRFVFETMPDGRPKRVVNRAAYISSMPYDERIDGPKPFQELLDKRKARAEGAFCLDEDYLISGVSITADPKREFPHQFKSKRLGTFAAEMWPAVVHRSGSMRVCWQIDERGEAERLPTWLLDVDASPAKLAEQHLVHARFKILGLDALRVEGNREILGFWRIDTDYTWPSVDACVAELRKKVDEGKLKCMPNFLVGLVLPDGRYVRPHMIWLLPPGMGVIAKGDPRNLRKFVACYYGFVHALADMGADAQAPATTQQVKNPLAELYHTWCGPDDFYSMKDHATCLDMRQNRDMLVRTTVASITGETVEKSCEFFSACLDVARTFLAQMHRDRDTIYTDAMFTGDRDHLIDRVQEALSGVHLTPTPGKRRNKVGEEVHRASAARWIVDNWDPSKLGGNRRLSNLKLVNEVKGIPTLKGRQRVAAAYSARKNADGTISALLTAHDEMTAEGLTVSKSALAKRAKVSRQTVINRYEDMQAALVERAAPLSKTVPLFYRTDIPAHNNLSIGQDMLDVHGPVRWSGWTDDDHDDEHVEASTTSTDWDVYGEDPDGPPDFGLLGGWSDDDGECPP